MHEKKTGMKKNSSILFTMFMLVFEVLKFWRIKYIFLRISRVDIVYIYTNVNTIWTKQEKLLDKTRVREIKEMEHAIV